MCNTSKQKEYTQEELEDAIKQMSEDPTGVTKFTTHYVFAQMEKGKLNMMSEKKSIHILGGEPLRH